MAAEGVPLVVIQRQLGHANLGITSIYLQGIDSSEIIRADMTAWPIAGAGKFAWVGAGSARPVCDVAALASSSSSPGARDGIGFVLQI